MFLQSSQHGAWVLLSPLDLGLGVVLDMVLARLTVPCLEKAVANILSLILSLILIFHHLLFRDQNLTAMADKLNDLAGRMGKAPKGLGLGAKLVAVGVGAYVGLQQSMYTVDGGHRAIMFNRLGGIQDYSLTEGLHFKLPWFQYPIIYDIRARPRKITSPTGSKDLQMVNISLRVLSRPDSMNLPALHKELGQDFDEKVGNGKA